MYRKVKPGSVIKQFTGAGPLDFPISLDSLGITAFYYVLYGYLIATYASGTPAARQGSLINSLFSSIQVVIEGVPVKSGSPEMFRFFAYLVNQFAPALRATSGATATDYPLTDLASSAVSATFGTTGQYQNFYEEGVIYAENMYCEQIHERLSTVIRTKGLSDAYVRFEQSSPNNILDSANTAPVVYTSLSTLNLRLDIEELKESVPGELDNVQFYGSLETFYQKEKTITFNGAVDGQQYDMLGIGGRVMGKNFVLRDGAAGSTTTATAKQKNDLILTKIEFISDDDKRYGETTWKVMKSLMYRRWAVSAPLASSLCETTGFNHLSWVKSRMSEAINLSSVKTFKAIITTAAQATATDYGTNGAVLKIMTDYVA